MKMTVWAQRAQDVYTLKKGNEGEWGEVGVRELPFDVKLPEEKGDSNHQDESKMVQTESLLYIKQERKFGLKYIF